MDNPQINPGLVFICEVSKGTLGFSPEPTLEPIPAPGANVPGLGVAIVIADNDCLGSLDFEIKSEQLPVPKRNRWGYGNSHELAIF